MLQLRHESLRQDDPLLHCRVMQQQQFVPCHQHQIGTAGEQIPEKLIAWVGGLEVSKAKIDPSENSFSQEACSGGDFAHCVEFEKSIRVSRSACQSHSLLGLDSRRHDQRHHHITHRLAVFQRQRHAAHQHLAVLHGQHRHTSP